VVALAGRERKACVTNREIEVRERPMALHVEAALGLSGALLGRVLSRQKSAVVHRVRKQCISMYSTIRS
jgi:hypothetical protein